MRKFVLLLGLIMTFMIIPDIGLEAQQHRQEKYVYGKKEAGKVQVLDERGRLIYKDVTEVGGDLPERHEILGYRECVFRMTAFNQNQPNYLQEKYNDIGPVTLARISTGLYEITIPIGGDQSKIHVQASNDYNKTITIAYQTTNKIRVFVFENGVLSDGLQVYVEIRLYN